MNLAPPSPVAPRAPLSPATAGAITMPGATTMPAVAAPPVAPPTKAPGTTPTGLPTWYGTRLGKQERSFFSDTGDVQIFAGHTFPTSFRTVNAAMQHAVTRAISQGGVAVMEDAGKFFITRLYNAEYAGHGRYEMRQSDFSKGFGKISHVHPALRAIVDAAGATFKA